MPAQTQLNLRKGGGATKWLRQALASLGPQQQGISSSPDWGEQELETFSLTNGSELL